MLSPTSLPASCFQENIFLRKNSSLGCLAGLEESLPHQRFQTSIQSWSLANEGFVRSLVTLPDNTHQALPPSQAQISTESLISDNFLQEPQIMEETSLVARQPPVSPVQDTGDHQVEAEEEKEVMAEEVVEVVEVVDNTDYDRDKILRNEEANKDEIEKQELENYQNSNDFTPKYQNDEIEKILELADITDKNSNFVESKNQKGDRYNQVSRESSQRSETSVKAKENPRRDPTESEKGAVRPAVKPVPAPRKCFLEESMEVKTDFQLEKFPTIRDRAKTVSYISSYYLEGTIPASAGTISKIFSHFQKIILLQSMTINHFEILVQ